MTSIRAVLFDLDGTLLDTAPDLACALNQLRAQSHLPPLPLPVIKPLISLGSAAMVKFAYDIDENHHTFKELKDKFLAIYQENLASLTRFFPHIDKVLIHLEQQHIPWGIVTNKLTHFTTKILHTLEFTQQPGCVICGDSLPTNKPDPAPILRACELLKQEPKHCLYVGDASSDVTASKAAGTKSLVALYGYIAADVDPYSWQADGYIQDPLEILDWIQSPITTQNSR